MSSEQLLKAIASGRLYIGRSDHLQFSADLLRSSLTVLNLPTWGSRKQMLNRLSIAKNSEPRLAYHLKLQSICRKRGLPMNGWTSNLKARIFALFGKIMRKCVFGILFCIYAKDGIRRALTMHAMLKRLSIQELRAKIYEEAKVMHVKQSKEDMFMALWAAMPEIRLPIFLTKTQADNSGLCFNHEDTHHEFYFYKRKWFVELMVRSRAGSIMTPSSQSPTWARTPSSSAN